VPLRVPDGHSFTYGFTELELFLFYFFLSEKVNPAVVPEPPMQKLTQNNLLGS